MNHHCLLGLCICTCRETIFIYLHNGQGKEAICYEIHPFSKEQWGSSGSPHTAPQLGWALVRLGFKPPLVLSC